MHRKKAFSVATTSKLPESGLRSWYFVYLINFLRCGWIRRRGPFFRHALTYQMRLQYLKCLKNETQTYRHDWHHEMKTSVYEKGSVCRRLLQVCSAIKFCKLLIYNKKYSNWVSWSRHRRRRRFNWQAIAFRSPWETCERSMPFGRRLPEWSATPWTW